MGCSAFNILPVCDSDQNGQHEGDGTPQPSSQTNMEGGGLPKDVPHPTEGAQVVGDDADTTVNLEGKKVPTAPPAPPAPSAETDPKKPEPAADGNH